jgi:hypothetical protein
MAVGFPTKANWAAGDVLTASAQDDLAGTLNLLSNASAASGSQLLSNAAGTSFAYQPVIAGGKNFCINGGFDIWQRNTSVNFQPPASVLYNSADRWNTNVFATYGATYTISRQNAQNVGSQYAARIQRNSGQTTATGIFFGTTLESATVAPLAGQTITISAYLRRGADAPTSSSAYYFQIRTGTGTDEGAQGAYNGTWTGYASVGTNPAVTTTSTKFIQTLTLGSGVRELTVIFGCQTTGTAGANDWFEVEEVQIEIGSISTAFSRAGGTLQGELAACQRYYWRATSVANFAQYGGNPAYDTANLFVAINLPVTMRVAPSVLDTSATSTFTCENSSAVSATALTSLSLNTNSNPNIGVVTVVKTASFTSGLYYKLISNSTTSGYIGFSGEL